MDDHAPGVIELRDDFYRDSFTKVTWLIVSMLTAVFLLLTASAYLFFKKPAPVVFPVSAEWRIQADVPLDQAYLSIPEVLQWTSDSLRKAFVYDFNNYSEQLQKASKYFTPDGWNIFLNQLNNYANYNNVQTNKLFVNGVPAGAPYILNQGILNGRYAWWVQMPLDINYVKNSITTTRSLTLQLLVVRVPTLNNLMGVGIDNVIVAKGAGT